MRNMFAVEQHDREFYESRLKRFLPADIIDIHAHIWLDIFRSEGVAAPRGAAWPAHVALDNSLEDLIETYSLLFPGKRITPMIFGFPGTQYDIEQENHYTADCCRSTSLPGLALTMPSWSAAEFESVIERGRFIGCKPYLDYADPAIKAQDITIYDFLPPRHLEVLDRHGWIVMLHLPRPGRLRDPENLRQLLEIDQKYPRAHIIVAHVGRAYCPEDVGPAFEVLKETRTLSFDFSANMNQYVFEKLLEAVGPRRVLFGSDLPILRIRAKRICENGNYVNIVRRGAYGNVAGDGHMREAAGREAKTITFLLYEQIDAFRKSCVNAGISARDVQDIFYGNARTLFHYAGYIGMEANK